MLCTNIILIFIINIDINIVNIDILIADTDPNTNFVLPQQSVRIAYWLLQSTEKGSVQQVPSTSRSY